MIVAIDADVLDAPEHEGEVDVILRTFEQGRHAWFVPDEAAILRTRYFKEAGVTRARRLRALLAQGEQHARPNLIVARLAQPERGQVVPPPRAAALLTRGLRVLVENADADGLFVQRVLLVIGRDMLRRRFGPERLRTLERDWAVGRGVPGWIELEHGGGGTLSARMRSLKVEPGPLFVLVDGDRRLPGVGPGPTAARALEVAEALSREPSSDPPAFKVEVWVLDQREVENYIPDEALAEQLGEGRTAWLVELSPEQRACWDHKRGLRAELEGEKGVDPPLDPGRWCWRSPEVGALFRDMLPHPDFVLGFGGRVWEALKRAPCGDPETLRRRGGPELDALATRILQLL